MPWVPVHESGVSFHLDEGGDAGVYLDGSTVTAEDAQNPNWRVVFGDSVRLRVTAVSYQSGGGCPWESPAWLDDVENEAVDPILGWEPVHIERDGYISIGYEAARGGECPVIESFQFLIEVWVEGGLVANDDEATTNAGTPVTVDVLANDTLDDEPVTLGDLAGPPTILSQPEFGEAVVEADGRITYTPPAGFAGEVEIPYMIETADAGCPELFFSNSVVPAEDVETAVGGFGANNIYFEFGGFTFSFHRTIDEEFWPDPGNYMPCNPSDVELPEFPWQVDLYWGDGGGGVCVSINNECF